MLTVLVIVAVINTAISAYYYLRLIVVMFFRERTTEFSVPAVPMAISLVISLTVFGVLYFGIFSESLIHQFMQVPQ